MAVDLPTNMPGVIISGYKIKPGKALLRTKMSGGADRQRIISRSIPRIGKVKWIMTGDQFSEFEYWYDNTANLGADWFNLTISNGFSTQSVEARFTREYDCKPTYNDLWSVTGSIEIRNYVLTPPGTFDIDRFEALVLRLDTDNTNYASAVSRLHTLINVTLPNYNL